MIQSDSGASSANESPRGGSSAIARPPGAQVRYGYNDLRVKYFGVRMKSDSTSLNRRRAQASTVQKPNSSRAAGAGGSSNTMLKLYTDDSPGLRVYVFHLALYFWSSIHFHWPLTTFLNSDPFVVIVLSLSFIGSIFFLHISAKIVKSFTK